MFLISTRLRFKWAHAKSQIPHRSHAQICIDVFVNSVIISVIYKFVSYSSPKHHNIMITSSHYHIVNMVVIHIIYMTSAHTSVFIVSLSKRSLTFKIIPGIPPRIDLILLVLICRVTPIIIKLWVLIYKVQPTNHRYVQIYVQYIQRIMKTYTRLYSGLNCTVHVSVCRHFGLSTFWSVDVLVCRCLGMSMFRFVDALVYRRFGLSTFRCVEVSAWRRFGCGRFGLSKFWPVTHKRIHFNTSKPGYKYGHHFADDILKWISWFFYNIALHEFYFLNMIYILVYIGLILSKFFQHSNILTRASHHWCLASNIVLVLELIFLIAVYFQLQWKQQCSRFHWICCVQ